MQTNSKPMKHYSAWLNKEVFDQPQKNFCIRDVKLKLIWLDKLKICENFAKEG